MKSLNRPVISHNGNSINDHEIYDIMLDQRRHLSMRNSLLAIKSLVSDKYNAYIALNGKLEDINRLAENHPNRSELDSLKKCYDYNTGVINTLRQAILATTDSCPYCQINNELNKRDHYLPKALFAEFSILSLNLIPTCDICNEIKSYNVFNQTERRIIHPYYDQINNHRFLCADISIYNDTPVVNYRVENIESIDPYLFEVIKKHFEVLNLQKRYGKISHKELHRTIRCFGRNAPCRKCPIEITRYFNGEADNSKENYGVNHWNTALLHGMAACDDIIGFLETVLGAEEIKWPRQ